VRQRVEKVLLNVRRLRNSILASIQNDLPDKAAVTSTLRAFRGDRLLFGFLAALLLIDATFISFHMFRGFLKEVGIDAGWLADTRFSLMQDRGYAEIFNFLKLAFVASMLAAVWKARRQALYVALACLYVIILADDALCLHEAGGELLYAWIAANTSLGVHIQDLGELVTWASLAAIAIPGLAHAWRQSHPKDRRIGFGFIACLALLAVFAVGVDMLHAIAPTHLVFKLIGAVEDGGELLVGSLTATLALLVWRHHRQLAGHPTTAETAAPPIHVVRNGDGGHRNVTAAGAGR
jgi:hypothetical protein